MKNNRGFGLIGIILIIVGVLVVGVGVAYFKDGGPKVPPGKKNILREEITNSQSIEIEFLSDEKINIVNGKFTVYLYGHDEFLMDAPATLITQKVYNETSIPFSITLPYPENAVNLIKKQNKDSVKKASYYIATEWDNNNDGAPSDKLVATSGDISIDWNNSKSENSDIELVNGKKYTVYLKQID